MYRLKTAILLVVLWGCQKDKTEIQNKIHSQSSLFATKDSTFDDDFKLTKQAITLSKDVQFKAFNSYSVSLSIRLDNLKTPQQLALFNQNKWTAAEFQQLAKSLLFKDSTEMLYFFKAVQNNYNSWKDRYPLTKPEDIEGATRLLIGRSDTNLFCDMEYDNCKGQAQVDYNVGIGKCFAGGVGVGFFGAAWGAFYFGYCGWNNIKQWEITKQVCWTKRLRCT